MFNASTIVAQTETVMCPGLSMYRCIVDRETSQRSANHVMVAPSRFMARRICDVVKIKLFVCVIVPRFLCRVPKTTNASWWSWWFCHAVVF